MPIDFSQIPFNRVRQKSSHNSFELPKPDFKAHIDQYNIYSQEYDIHIRKGAFDEHLKKDWYIYHESVFSMEDTNCKKLTELLAQCREVHDRPEGHEVITVFIDTKNNPFYDDDDQRPADLDSLLIYKLGEGAVFRSSDLLGDCHSLHDAVARLDAWPTMGQLRNKFIFVLTGGKLSRSRSNLEEYMKGTDPRQRVLFVAPELDRREDIMRDEMRDAVFFNLDTDRMDERGREIFERKFIARAFSVESDDEWSIARQHSIQHIATNNLTRAFGQPPGKPFETIV